MNKQFNYLETGSVTSPKGYLASGVAAGIKVSGKSDMALLVSAEPAQYSGAFTSCIFAAAPVRICRERFKQRTPIRAVVINSGNANACTGERGLANSKKMCQLTAKKLRITPSEVLVSSTGRIGVQLPMDKIGAGITLAAEQLSHHGGIAAAKAIMTTDTVMKSAAVEVELGNKKVVIGGMAKGVGMLAPDLKIPHATLLCYLTTDADIDVPLLDEMLHRTVDLSFNRITVDGDTSTNDTVLLMANGAAGVKIVPNTSDAEIFAAALQDLMEQLAREIVMDGEGATKFVTIRVDGAPDEAAARACAKTVGNSLLCKTAWFGNDPNWGRIVAALGRAGVEFDPDKVDVWYEDLPVVRRGGDAGTPESALAKIMENREFVININLNSGDADYWVWTCDISYEYVKINAEYHT